MCPTVNRWQDLNTLILVGGHAIHHGMSGDDVLCDNNWFLYDFQKGEPHFFVEHIKRGVEEASRDSNSLLIFSGGQTRESVGPISESQSYWLIAEKFSWWSNDDVRNRSTTEEFARDTFENILFSICRYYECTGKYPEYIKSIGWGFKKNRYIYHYKTLKFPIGKFHHIVVNDPVDIVTAEKNEYEKCCIPFQKDPFGISSSNLTIEKFKNEEACISLKRLRRNPFRRNHPYINSCPELAPLLCAYNPYVPLTLPWNSCYNDNEGESILSSELSNEIVLK